MLSFRETVNPGYAVLYFPPAGFGYVAWKWSGEFSLATLFSLELRSLFLALAVLTTIGAVLMHQYFEAIFGPGGPKQNPKMPSVVFRELYRFLIGIPIEAETIRGQIAEIGQQGTFYTVIRGATFSIPLFVLRYSYVLVLIPLAHVALSTKDFPAAILFAANALFELRRWLSSQAPPYIAPEASERLDTPEYKRWQESNGGQNENE